MKGGTQRFFGSLLRISTKAAVVLSLSGPVVTGCVQRPEPPLRVGSHVWPGYEPLFLARSLGYYDSTSIQLLEYPSAPEIIRAFENRAIDVATLTMHEVLRLADTEQDPRVVLVMDFSRGADVVVAKPEVQSLADLKGRRVGVETHALGAFMLTRALETASLSVQDVRVVPMRIYETEEALQSGQVDAVVTFEPYRTRLLAAGARLLFDSRRIPHEISDVLCVRKSFLERPNPTLHRLIEGWFRALDYLQQNPSDAARRMAAREGVAPEQFLASLQGIIIPNRLENQRLLSAADPTLTEGARKLARVMLKYGLLKKEVDLAHIWDDRLVKREES